MKYPSHLPCANWPLRISSFGNLILDPRIAIRARSGKLDPDLGLAVVEIVVVVVMARKN
jgi:hypothetical protein